MAGVQAVGIHTAWEQLRYTRFYNIVPEVVRGCKENNIMINPFTVDQLITSKRWRPLVLMIITNVPDIALKIRRKWGLI